MKIFKPKYPNVTLKLSQNYSDNFITIGYEFLKTNLWYIASPPARRMETDNTTKEIRIFGKKPAPLAVFRFY